MRQAVRDLVVTVVLVLSLLSLTNCAPAGGAGSGESPVMLQGTWKLHSLSCDTFPAGSDYRITLEPTLNIQLRVKLGMCVFGADGTYTTSGQTLTTAMEPTTVLSGTHCSANPTPTVTTYSVQLSASKLVLVRNTDGCIWTYDRI